MSAVEILNELKRIRGKFLKDEGIYIFPKPDLHVLPEYFVSTTPIETDVIDLSNYGGQKLFFLKNDQDVSVLVDFLAGYLPTGDFYTLRSDVEVPANDMRVALLNERHLYVKLRMRASSPPTSGRFYPFLVRWSM